MSNRTGYLALVIVLILVLGRTVLATQDSLVTRTDSQAAMSAPTRDPLLARVADEDSLLRAPGGNRRDPFRPWNPPTTGTPLRVTPVTPLPPPLVPPRVVVFMQDGSSTIVQFEVDGDTSPRLPVGGSFRGWTITGISGRSVTLFKDGQQFEVPRP